MGKKVKLSWWIGLALSFACCALYAGMLSFKTMPISEGWYSEYAWQINHGFLPYRDFEYLFLPLYLFIISGITRIFGYSIIVLRIVGILVYGGIGVMLYCIFSKLFDNLSGLIAAVVAALFLQSEVGQVFYDYIRFHDLFALVAAYLILCITESNRDGAYKSGKRLTKLFVEGLTPTFLILSGGVGLYQISAAAHPVRFLLVLMVFCGGLVLMLLPPFLRKNGVAISNHCRMLSIMCGIFISAECMIKQSNGALMIAFAVVYLIYCAIILKNKNFIYDLVGVLSGIILSFSCLLLYLLSTDSLDAFIQCCFKNALSAKGGLVLTLFAWIPRELPLFWQEKWKALVIAIFLLGMIGWYSHKRILDKKIFKSELVAIAGLILGLGIWVVVKNSVIANEVYIRYDVMLPELVFFFCSILFFGYAIYLFVCRIKGISVEKLEFIPMFSILGVVFTQGYGSGLSGGLASSQTAIGMGLLLSLAMHVALRARIYVAAVCAMIVALYIGATCIGRKTVQTYYWWGLTQGALSEHTEETNVPLLAGIKVREMDKAYYEVIYSDVVNNTTEDDAIFVFPHAPVVYTLTDRHSKTYTKVQWFDVSGGGGISHDIEMLRVEPPKVIVYVNLPDMVYEGHESLFMTYQTRTMRDFLLNELIPGYQYTLLHTMDLGNGYTVSTYLLPQK